MSLFNEIAQAIGYKDDEIKDFTDANLGLGCGNPTALGEIQEGEVVLDLGSGPGLDCFLAAKKVGVNGTVIGVGQQGGVAVFVRFGKEPSFGCGFGPGGFVKEA